jgi:hypothetical protein
MADYSTFYDQQSAELVQRSTAASTAPVTVSFAKGDQGFGIRLSVEGMVTGYSVPGGAAEVRDAACVPGCAPRRCRPRLASRWTAAAWGVGSAPPGRLTDCVFAPAAVDRRLGCRLAAR